jgi:hypothetical protein
MFGENPPPSPFWLDRLSLTCGPTGIWWCISFPYWAGKAVHCSGQARNKKKLTPGSSVREFRDWQQGSPGPYIYGLARIGALRYSRVMRGQPTEVLWMVLPNRKPEREDESQSHSVFMESLSPPLLMLIRRKPATKKRIPPWFRIDREVLKLISVVNPRGWWGKRLEIRIASRKNVQYFFLFSKGICETLILILTLTPRKTKIWEWGYG